MANYGYVDNDGGRGNYGAKDSGKLQYLVIYQHNGSPVENIRRISPTKDQPITSNYARPNASGEDKSSDNPVFSKLRDLYLEYRDGANISDIKSTDDDYRKPNRLLSKPKDYAERGQILPNVNAVPKQGKFTAPVLLPGNKNIGPEMSQSSRAATQHNKEAVEKHDVVDRAIKPSVVTGATKQGQFTAPVLQLRNKNNYPEISRTLSVAKQHDKEASEKHDGVKANINNKDDFKKFNPPPSKQIDELDTAIKPSINGKQILSNVPRAAKQGQFTGLLLSPGKKNIHPDMSQSSGAPKPHDKEAAEKHDGVMTNISSKPMNEIDKAMEGNKLSNVPAATKKAHYWGPVLSLQKSNLHPEMSESSLKVPKKHSKDSNGKFSRTISSKEAVEKYDGALVP